MIMCVISATVESSARIHYCKGVSVDLDSYVMGHKMVYQNLC